MKVLLSSRYLANELAKIDFDNERVLFVVGDRSQLIIITRMQSIYLEAETIISAPISQNNRRWDWIKLLVSKIDDQPLVLDIQENITNVIFQY